MIMAGRLDMERTVYENRLDKLHDGSTMIYEYDATDGTTLVPTNIAGGPDLMLENGMLPRSVRLQLAFQGVLARHRYTQALAGTDLSKVIFAYGTMDRRVGRLTEQEVEFLESRNARVVAVEGGHASMAEQAAARARILELVAQ